MKFKKSKRPIHIPLVVPIYHAQRENLGIFIAVFMQFQQGGLKYYGNPREEDMSSSCILPAFGTISNSWWRILSGYARSGCCLPFQPHCWLFSTWLSILQPTGIYKE